MASPARREAGLILSREGLHEWAIFTLNTEPLLRQYEARFPLLQVDTALLAALHRHGFEIAVETNGSLPAPPGIDWICVSPKAGADWVQRSGQELKLVYPQPGLMPEDVERAGTQGFDHLLLQPMDSPLRRQHTRQAIAHCQAHPRWRLSVQTHKILEIR